MGALWRLHLRYLWRSSFWVSTLLALILGIALAFRHEAGSAVAGLVAPLTAIVVVVVWSQASGCSTALVWSAPCPPGAVPVSQVLLLAVLSLAGTAFPLCFRLLSSSRAITPWPVEAWPLMAFNIWTGIFVFGLAGEICRLSLQPPRRDAVLVITFFLSLLLIGAHGVAQVPKTVTVIQIGLVALCLALYFTAHARLEAAEVHPTREASSVSSGTGRRGSDLRSLQPLLVGQGERASSPQPSSLAAIPSEDRRRPELRELEPVSQMQRHSHGGGNVLRRLVLRPWWRTSLLALGCVGEGLVVGGDFGPGLYALILVPSIYLWHALSIWWPFASSPLPRRRAFIAVYAPILVVLAVASGLRLLASSVRAFDLVAVVSEQGSPNPERSRQGTRYRLHPPGHWERGAVLLGAGLDLPGRLSDPLDGHPRDVASKLRSYLKLVHALDVSVEGILAFQPSLELDRGRHSGLVEWVDRLQRDLGPSLRRSRAIRAGLDSLFLFGVVLASTWLVLRLGGLSSASAVLPAVAGMFVEALTTPGLLGEAWRQHVLDLYALAVAYPLPVLGSAALTGLALLYLNYRSFRSWQPTTGGRVLRALRHPVDGSEAQPS